MLAALLGFFESSVAARSLRSSTSPNSDTDLVALGVANLVGGCFSTLPAFGGFGRSKLNVQAGGMTRMSSVFLVGISLTCALYATPWLYYVPRSTLAAMSIAVGISMIEEAYPDFVAILASQAWRELVLMLVVFFSIILHSMGLGIVPGLSLSIMALIRDSTLSPTVMKSKTLKLSGNQTHSSNLTSVEMSYLHVKIGTSLTYINIGYFNTCLMERISRLDRFRGLVLDFHNTTRMDFCAGQILKQMVEGLVDQRFTVLLCRPSSDDIERALVDLGVLCFTKYAQDLAEARVILKRSIQMLEQPDTTIR